MFDANLALSQLTNSSNPTARLNIMVGAKSFAKSDEENFVAFRFTAKSKFNYCKITLQGNDLYTLTIQKYIWSKFKMTKEVIIENLYFDQLKGQFEENTGLYLSL